MHYLKIDCDVSFGKELTIKKGEYVTEDLSGAQIMTYADGGTMRPLTIWDKFDETQDWNGKRILMIRIGGFGDLTVGITPTAREIKRRWPTCIIHVACMRHYAPVLHNLSFIDATVDDPIPVDDFNNYDAQILFENAVERNPQARKLHMTDLFAEIAGLKGTVRDLSLLGKGPPAILNKLPAYVPTEDEKTWARVQYPRTPLVRRICIQPSTSARCRTYPTANLSEVMKSLLEKGWEVFLMGAMGDVQRLPETDKLKNLTSNGLTFRQSCAVINDADIFLGSDSALLHIAGALSKPAIGLYGPFPADLRVRYCPTTVALSGQEKCSPCFHHATPTRRNNFPDYCPSAARGLCEVLESIKPDRIVAKIEKMIPGVVIHDFSPKSKTP